MRAVTRFVTALLIASTFTVLSTGCTAGSLTGPQETVEQPAKPTPPAQNNGNDGANTDPGGNDHNISHT
jgi:hypothetical protein